MAQRRPELLVPHAGHLVEIVASERNSPAYHVFTLGLIGAVEPEAVPLDDVKIRPCSLPDRGSGNGYRGWAADTLRRISGQDVLPDLRTHAPATDSDGGDGTHEVFRDAIAELESQ